MLADSNRVCNRPDNRRPPAGRRRRLPAACPHPLLALTRCLPSPAACPPPLAATSHGHGRGNNLGGIPQRPFPSDAFHLIDSPHPLRRMSLLPNAGEGGRRPDEGAEHRRHGSPHPRLTVHHLAGVIATSHERTAGNLFESHSPGGLLQLGEHKDPDGLLCVWLAAKIQTVYFAFGSRGIRVSRVDECGRGTKTPDGLSNRKLQTRKLQTFY